MPKVGILGATGYTGVELVRLLSTHPEVEISVMTSERSVGQNFSAIFPAFRGRCDMELSPLQVKAIAKQSTIVFCCLPHEQAMQHVPSLLEYGCKVVDLSADFRLDSAAVYREWYTEHSAPSYLSKKVYGLPERYRAEIKDAYLIANPGCYPTATLLGLFPLLQQNLISTSGLICDAKSGTSGAGRATKQDMLFCEVNEGFKPYGVAKHRHTPEIEQELSKLVGEDITVRFTPHLVPMDRGMCVTTYARPLRKLSTAELIKVYQKHYVHEPFVRVLPEGQFPSTKAVRGSNYCDIAVHYDQRTQLIVIMSVIDNLVKGASGQAVQNMNLMYGFAEDLGINGAPWAI